MAHGACRAWSVAAAVAATAAGCSSFRAPSVAVTGVSVSATEPEALGLSIATELENPNKKPMELYEFTYTVFVDGVEVYSGRRAGGVTLRPGTTRAVELPAVVPYHRLGWSAGELPPAARYSLQGTLRYVAPNHLAEILFDTRSRRPTTGFSDRGRLELR